MPKSLNLIGVLGKDESSYLGGGSLSASTDGLQLVLESRDGIPIAIDWLSDGKNGMAPGGLGELESIVRRGRWASFAARVQFRGAGAAYSSTVKHSLFRWLGWAGHDATGTFTGGSEKWDHTPTADAGTMASGVMEAYTRAEKYPLTGVFCDWGYEFKESGIPIHTFDVRGVCGVPSSTAVPAITYPYLTVPFPDVAGAVLTLGNFTGAVLKGGSFKMNRKLEQRAGAQASDLHMGWIQRGWDPTWELEIEATAFAASEPASAPYTAAAYYDPYKLYENATKLAFSLAFPAGGQYNKVKHTAAIVQVTAPPSLTQVNGVPCYKLQLKPRASSPVANDTYALTVE